MKYFPLLILSFFLQSNVLSAQTEAEHTLFAKSIVAYLSDSTYHPGVELIRINLWLDLMKEQEFSNNELIFQKNKINQGYNTKTDEFMLKMNSLRKEYLTYIQEGATFEFYDNKVEIQENRKKMFTNKVRFLVISDELQNLVTLRFNSAYVLNHLVLTTPVKDTF